MKCFICDEYFNERRCLKDLFRTKYFYVCEKCIKKYPLKIENNIIPLDSHTLEITALFEKERRINYDFFICEYSLIYKKICELNVDKMIFFTNKLYLNEEILEHYNQISLLLDKDIIILTNILFV